MPTLTQTRGKDALDKVHKLENSRDQKFNNGYTGIVVAFPAMILMNGLGQALATLLSSAKTDSCERMVYTDLESWLCGSSKAAPFPKEPSLIDALMACERATYIRAQVEALEWLTWMKKFSVAYLRQDG